MSGQDSTVGIDIGTTSVKAVAVDARGTIVARARVRHPVMVPAADRLEHDARRAWRLGPRRAMAKLADLAPRAAAVSTMVPSLTAVDGRGRPVAPGLLYGDGRGRGHGGEVLGFLRWLVAEAPGAAGYWPAPAVANHALGGRGVVDIGTAFAAGPLYGAEGWDAELLAECGLDRAALPSVQMMGAPIGKVTGSNTVLACGSIDGLCEQMVSGATATGDVIVMCGTTLITWVVIDEERSVEGLWTIPHSTSGMWLIGGPSNSGGLFLDWAVRVAARVRPGEAIDPDDVPVWLPYIRGERTPLHDPDRRASLHGLNLVHGPAAVRRAAWEASAFVVRHHVDLAGAGAQRIVAVGGGTKVDGWMQALADGTALPVHVSAVPEGAALGAAYLARMALGEAEGFDGAAGWARTDRVVDPDPAWVGPAAKRYELFRALSAEGHSR